MATLPRLMHVINNLVSGHLGSGPDRRVALELLLRAVAAVLATAAILGLLPLVTGLAS